MKKLASLMLLVAGSFGSLALAAEPKPAVEFVTAPNLPPGVPFSSAVRVGNPYYRSGQVGVVPGKMQLVAGGIKEQAAQAMENIGSVLALNGLGFDDVVKCTVMLADMGEWGAFNDVYRTYFKHHYPARSAFATAGLVLGARVEVECVAQGRD